MIRCLHFALAMLAAAALFGCAVSSPKVNFYTLPAPPYPETRGAYSIVLAPVTLPETVDRPQLVIRTGANQVEIVDTSRWAQPLKNDAARVLAANLAQELGTLRVFLSGQGISGEPDIRVAVDILRFDSRPGMDASLEALWTVRRKGGGAPLTGRSAVREAVGGDGYDPLVAAHGRALAKISHDIAEAIRKGNF